MVTVTFEPPEDMFSSVQKALERFTQKLRLDAVRWCEMGIVFQSRAAEISGLSAANLSRR